MNAATDLTASRQARPRSAYVVGPAYDWVFFLMPPVVSLGIGYLVARSESAHARLQVLGADSSLSALLLGILIHAHLVAVFFRSHGNPGVFPAHRVRFVVVPLVLFAAIVSVPWVAIASIAVATFWDVYHSGAQTFGFGRIYDRNAGASPEHGRRLDFVLNQVLYAGPILAGVSFAAHVGKLEEFGALEDPFAAFLTNVPAHALAHHGDIARAVVAVGTAFIVYYVVANVRMARAGHVVSPLKIGLYATTGLCSIYTWAFDSWGEAFLVMNLFHAVQYLALVWATEGGRLVRRFARAGRLAVPVAVAVFVVSVIAYGATIELIDPSFRLGWAVSMVVSLMHFWYDGFVWSVRADAV